MPKIRTFDNNRNLKLILNAQEEYNNSDGKSQEKLELAIKNNIKLVYQNLNKYEDSLKKVGRYEDAYSKCLTKLSECILNYDISKANFATYAMYCLENIVKMELRKRKLDLKSISLEEKFIVKKNELRLEDMLPDEKNSFLEDDVIDEILRYKLLKRFPYFISDEEYAMLKLRNEGLALREIAEILGKSRSLYSRKCSKLMTFANNVVSLSQIEDIEAFIRKDNLKNENIVKVIKNYTIAKNIFGNKKIDFDECYTFLKYDIRERFLLKKVGIAFKCRQKRKDVLNTISTFYKVDLEKFKCREQSYGSVSVDKKEAELNICLNEIFILIKNLQSDIILKRNDIDDEFLTKFSLIYHYRKDLKKVLIKQKNKMDARQKRIFEKNLKQIEIIENQIFDNKENNI